MDTEQVETLSQRLREIGFSDRAVSMIVEQVIQIDKSRAPSEGLSEQAATYAAMDDRSDQTAGAAVDTDVRTLTIVGALASLVSIILGWSAITSTGQAELAIMAGSPSEAPSWFQGIQAMLLAAWIALPPLLAVWQGDAGSKLRQTPLLAVWGGVGLALATLLLASAA